MRISFESTSDYFSFVFAREFRHKDAGGLYRPSPSIIERLGSVIASPILGLSNKLLQNLNNPLLIIAATMVLIAAVSIAFYPATTIHIIGTVAPFLLKVTPAMTQFALYAVVQITTLGIGLRALGRMSNHALVDLWNQKKLVPIQIGAISI